MPFLDEESSFSCKTDAAGFQRRIAETLAYFPHIEEHLKNRLEHNPALIDFSKWGRYLPSHLQYALLKEEYYDFDGTKQFLENFQLIGVNKQ